MLAGSICHSIGHEDVFYINVFTTPIKPLSSSSKLQQKLLVSNLYLLQYYLLSSLALSNPINIFIE